MKADVPAQQKRPPIRWLNLFVLGIPPLVSVTIVPWYGFTVGYDGYEWAWMIALLCFCELSITAGYHRLWSHRAYKANGVLKFIFALGGACALQNNCITWAADHRRHHLYADNNDRDPYSAGKGFWYSHFGWMIRDYKSTQEDLSNVQDLLDEPVLAWQRKHYLVLLLIMNVGLPVMLGWLHGNIWGSLLLAGFLRLTLSQHFTYLINSAAHIWGSRTYSPDQTARDNWFIALLTFGEGYHNYHHTFAFDYRNGIKWYHYDPTKWLIRSCAFLGLASDLRTCSFFRQEITRIDVQYRKALKHCDFQLDPRRWRETLEKEYSQVKKALHEWNGLRQRWLEAKSAQLHEHLHELDFDHLKQHYESLKAEMLTQRRRWHLFNRNLALAYPGS